MASLYLAQDRGEAIPYDFVRREIERIRPQVGDDEAERMMLEANRREQSELEGLTKKERRMEINAGRQRIVDESFGATVSAREGIAGSVWITDREIELSDGSVHTMQRADQIEAHISRFEQQLAANSATPEEATSRMDEYTALNNFVHPRWAALYEAGAGAGLSAFLSADGKPAQPAEFPKTTEAAFKLWISTSQRNHAAHASPETALFFNRMQIAYETVDAGNVPLLR